jgi:hypothetical protein
VRVKDELFEKLTAEKNLFKQDGRKAKMNPALKKKAVLGILFGVILCAFATSVQGFARPTPLIRPFVPPPLVRFTGTLSPLGEKGGDGLHTLRVFVKDKEWLLHLENVETLTATNRIGWMILSDLFPRQLHLIGPADLLSFLQAAEQTGKPVSIEGRLYFSDRMFAVTAAGEAPDKPS